MIVNFSKNLISYSYFSLSFFQFEESIPCFQKSLEINSLQVGPSRHKIYFKNHLFSLFFSTRGGFKKG